MVPQAVANGVGTEVDNAAISLRAHLGDRVPGTPQYGPEIAVDRGFQRFRRLLGESLDDAAAGIVDEDVEAAEAFACEIDGLFRRALIREIAGMAGDLGAEFLAEMGTSLFQSGLVEVGKHQLGAVSRQSLGNRKANALGGTGDDGNIVPELLVHYLGCFHRMMLTRPWARRPSLSSRQRFSLIRKVPSPGTRRYLLLPKYVSVTPSLVR